MFPFCLNNDFLTSSTFKTFYWINQHIFSNWKYIFLIIGQKSGWVAYIHRICLYKSPLCLVSCSSVWPSYPTPEAHWCCWESVSSSQGSGLDCDEKSVNFFPCMSLVPLFHVAGHPHFYYSGIFSIFWALSTTSLLCCSLPWLGSGILILSQTCSH